MNIISHWQKIGALPAGMIQDCPWCSLVLSGLLLAPAPTLAAIAHPDTPAYASAYGSDRNLSLSRTLNPAQGEDFDAHPLPKRAAKEIPCSSLSPVEFGTRLTARQDVVGVAPLPLEGISTDASDLTIPGSEQADSHNQDLSAAAIDESQTPPPETEAASETAQTSNNAAPAELGLGERSRLTGNWGGTRTQWEEAGITLDLEFTQFLQGLAAGGTLNIPSGIIPSEQLPRVLVNPPDVGYGGRLDGFIRLDTEKLGWWDGGKLNVHLEYNFSSTQLPTGLTFFRTNTGIAFPSGGPDVLAATSLYLSQQLGTQGSLLIGKINALDLLENDPFFGGWGIHRFQNVVFAGPPSGLVPPVMFGAIGSLRLDPVTLSLWIYDPEDRTQDYWLNGLFSEGVTFYPSITYNTQIAGRPTTFSLNGIYTTKSGIDFSSITEAARLSIEPSTKQGSYSIGFQFSHLFHQLESNPRQGWGVFVKGAISDGNPNYVQNSIIAGIGGYGLFPKRELDSFGVGYFYYNLSNELQSQLDLILGSNFRNEQGFEAYYSYAVTPWFFLAGDVQYISQPRDKIEDAFILGLRANIRF